MPDRRLRVLYIDDDPGLVRLIQRVLSRHGHTVEHAESAEQGLARIAEGGIDLLCLDHHLPAGTGLDVLNVLRQQPQAPPVVYVTGSSDMQVAVSALKSGAYDYVAKSATGEFPDLLVNAVEQAAERARLLRAKERAEAELRTAKERAELLLEEANHRVANSLAMVSSLLQLQSCTLDEPAARSALLETQGRIAAIAAVHRRLRVSGDFRSIELRTYLGELIREIESSVLHADVRVASRLESVRLPSAQATSVGLIAMELLTNALKYAYPTGGGEVRVVLRQADDNTVELRVEDDGVGWSATDRPKGSGLGSRLIDSIAASLPGTVEYDNVPIGTRALLRFRGQEHDGTEA